MILASLGAGSAQGHDFRESHCTSGGPIEHWPAHGFRHVITERYGRLTLGPARLAFCIAGKFRDLADRWRVRLQEHFYATVSALHTCAISLSNKLCCSGNAVGKMLAFFLDSPRDISSRWLFPSCDSLSAIGFSAAALYRHFWLVIAGPLRVQSLAFLSGNDGYSRSDRGHAANARRAGRILYKVVDWLHCGATTVNSKPDIGPVSGPPQPCRIRRTAVPYTTLYHGDLS